MRRYIVEFIGTFFLVFTVCTAVLSNASLAPIAIGGILAAMIFAGGHISGGHFNPAVSVAAYVRGKLDVMDLAWYVGAQLVAGLAAAGIARFVVDTDPTAFTVSGRGLWAAVVAELLFTFALAYTVLNVATSKDHPNNSFYGLAIGLVVLAGATAVGFGISLAGLVSWKLIWVYLIVCPLGGALAGYAFRALNPDDVEGPAPGANLAKRVPAGRRPS